VVVGAAKRGMLPQRAGPFFAHSVGLGFLGTLGLGHFRDAPRPVPVPSLSGVPMACAAAGWGHSAFVSCAGDAFVVGLPGDFKNTLRHINMRVASPFAQRLVTAASGALFPRDWEPRALPAPAGGGGWAHAVCSPGGGTALLCASGALHVMGGNAFGQLGNRAPSAKAVAHEPARVGEGWAAPGERVTGVALGLEHALAVTEGGGCYAWGRGERGQLGTGAREHFSAPVRLLEGAGGEDWLAARIVAVEAGVGASFAIDSEGALWTWGKMQGVEGAPTRLAGSVVMADQLLPRRVAFGDEASGSEGGGGGADGRGDGAATPRGPRGDTLPAPMLLAPWESAAGAGAPLPLNRRRRRVLAVTAGAAHASLLTDDGQLWMVGMRGRGVQHDGSGGPGEDPTAPHPPEGSSQTAPLPIPPGPLAGRAVVALRSSLHHSYALTAEGELFRWGWRGRVQRFLGPGQAWPPESQRAGEGAAGDAGGGGGGSGDTPLAFAEARFGFAHAACLMPLA
jgi:hypothetical protein